MLHTEIALKRPVTTVMFFVAFGLIGLLAARLLPLEQWPDIEFPGIFIQIPYQGSTPEEIEQLITRPIEEALATLPGVEQMRSTTTDNQVDINLQFGWDKEVKAAGIDARAKIDAIRHTLPDDLDRILVFTGSTSDQPILVLRISSDQDLSQSYELLDRHLKRRVERLDGVSRVALEGVDPREIRILLDVDRVAAHNIDIRELKSLLEKSNFAVSAGRITDNSQRFSVRPRGEFTSLADIREIVIDNRDLRLGDVATVTTRVPERNYGRHLDRKYAIGLSVFKATGANMVEVNDRVMEEVDKIRKLPQMAGIRMIDLDNQGESVRKSLSDLRNAGLMGAGLAILVLFLFLRQISTTLIVTLAVPFSLLITLAMMYFLGLTLNILTMMGLMLAIGMLVDNGVVVTESIFRYRQMYPDDPFKATYLGVQEVAVAVFAGTATSIIVFLPIMFGTKIDITVFLTHVAFTIVIALIASLVIAQTLIPMLAARLKTPPLPKDGALMPRVTNKYISSLRWTMNHPWWTALAILIISVASVTIPPKMINFNAFPQESKRRLFLPYNIDGNYPLARIESVVNRMEEYLYNNQEDLDMVTVYSYFDQVRAQSTILLKPKEEATKSTREIIEKIEAEMPEIVIGKPSFNFDDQGSGEGFSVQLMGDSTEQLNALGEEVERIFEGLDGLSGVFADSRNGEPEVRVVVDRERAMSVGISTEEIAGSVALAMRGTDLREFRGEDGEIKVRLEFRESDRQTIDDLAAIPLYTDTGQRITLGSVARFEVSRGPQQIQRVDRRTAVVINGNLDDETSFEDIEPVIQKTMDQLNMPPGYTWKFGRGFEREDETQVIMLQNTLMGVALIFIVMAALFESILFPLSIIMSIVFAVFGVFWFFAITNTTFSFMASIGIMILIGVVVNNGIVLIDHVNHLRREGMPRNEAMLQGGRDRLRPILMTVATTILGLTPLAVSTTMVGGGGPPYFPMARAIIGGLAFSTVTSLYVVPFFYNLFDNLAKWWRKVRMTARSATVATN